LHVKVKELSLQAASVINAIHHCCPSLCDFGTVYIRSNLLSRKSAVGIVTLCITFHLQEALAKDK